VTPLRELVGRARQLPPRAVPGAATRYAVRAVRSRARRWAVRHARGELSDRALLRATGAHSLDEVLALFARPGRPRFFFAHPAEARERARQLEDAYPHLADRTRWAADQALRHVVDLLGSGPIALDEPIDWHADFTCNPVISWPPNVLAEDQDYLRLREPCDVKVPWELSRCHHWVTLGRAYALDQDPRYAREFVAQLDAWLDRNPWPYGVNWGRAMEVAVRAVNWIWAAALFADAPEFDTRSRVRLLKALLQHGRHILDNLEFSTTNGNHYLSNGVGLLFLGVLYPEFAGTDAWRRKGKAIVWGEIEHQVHPDGVDFEQAIGYQGLVIDFWASCLRLCDLNGVAVPPSARARLARMFDFTLAYTRPDGTFPQVGDNDDGRLAGLDDEPVGSHRRLLAVGGALFDRGDLLAAAGEALETAVWLCGSEVLTAPRAPAEPRSRAFPDGGFYVMRAPDALMLVDAGEVGMRGIGGHGHNDVLSFDLWAAGAPLLVDPGTYVYTADPPARQALRATAAHNSLRVDGRETSRLGGDHWLWRIEDDAHPRVLRWESDAMHDLLEAEHDGYRRLPMPVTHRRLIHFNKLACAWRIDDSILGEGEHLIELFFHPARPIDEVVDGGVRLRAPNADLWLLPPDGLELRQQDGWVSRGYGYRERAPVLVYSARTISPVSLTTRLLLVPTGTPLAAARSLFESIAS
jgi:heparinase II/III-like protein